MKHWWQQMIKITEDVSMKRHTGVFGILISIGVIGISGCTSPDFDSGAGGALTSRFDDAVLDTEGVDSQKLQSDVASCRKIRDSSTKFDLVGAVVGAAVGAAIGNEIDDDDGAVVGGVIGGLAGSYDEAPNEQSIFRNCLKGRGYRVLN